MYALLHTWILSLMMFLQPVAGTPWAEGYDATAEAIASAATSEPVYAGPHAVERTAALVTSIAWFESRFKPDAVGDKGQSVCLLQIGVSNLRQLGVTREEMLADRATCLRAGLKMIRTSFQVCRGRPELELLGHYASGGRSCGGRHGRGLAPSRHRVELALRLLREHPDGRDGT